jgi:TRIAD3 protein (E3 ubiquitin-protein ligase RNF216)
VLHIQNIFYVSQDVLKPSVLSKMLQRKQMEEVKAAGIEDLESCPFCDFASIPPQEDKVFRCLNPDCMRESCRYVTRLFNVLIYCSSFAGSKSITSMLIFSLV